MTKVTTGWVKRAYLRAKRRWGKDAKVWIECEGEEGVRFYVGVYGTRHGVGASWEEAFRDAAAGMATEGSL